MYLRASELGWTTKEFNDSTQRLFYWEWEGYIRRIERSSYSAAREVVAIVRNTSVSKRHQKSPDKIFPLSIDFTIEFNRNDAMEQAERMKQAGWLNRLN